MHATADRKSLPLAHRRRPVGRRPGRATGRPATAVKGKADPLARLEKRLKSRASTDRERAYEDLFWALLNSSEMAMQH